MATSPTKAVVFPLPPPTTNTLTVQQRNQLLRKTKKLEQLLGAAPHLVDTSISEPSALAPSLAPRERRLTLPQAHATSSQKSIRGGSLQHQHSHQHPRERPSIPSLLLLPRIPATSPGLRWFLLPSRPRPLHLPPPQGRTSLATIPFSRRSPKPPRLPRLVHTLLNRPPSSTLGLRPSLHSFGLT